MMVPLISVVVLGFSNFDVTTRVCLESLVPWFNDPDIEVIVVDNGSSDGSEQKTQAWCAAYLQVKCLLSGRNRGFAGGMNWGVDEALGKWVLLVNNDTVFPTKTIDAFKQVLREVPPNVAMLGPVTNAAGNGQRLWKSDASHEEWLRIGGILNERPTHQLIPAYRCDFFCIAIRHDVWNQLGGLDLDFGLGYYEDFDFSMRLTLAGYSQMITEDVFILHIGSATFQANNAAKALIKKNKKLLRSKHPLAHFEHTRIGNLAVLQTYQALKVAGQWTSELELREHLRADALEGDAPRSFLKRWLWKKKIERTLRVVL